MRKDVIFELYLIYNWYNCIISLQITNAQLQMIIVH